MTTFEGPGPAPAPCEPADPGMKYWVFDSWSLGKAIVHKDDCDFCANGTHRQGSRNLRNGTWRGPFAGRAEAFALGRALGRKTMRGCMTCAP